MRDAVRATLELIEYQKRDITPAELKSAFADADEQIRLALEPFGYYDVQVDKKLSGDPEQGWKAHFDVKPGNPAIVRSARVEVHGEGADQRRVRGALDGFAPKVG